MEMKGVCFLSRGVLKLVCSIQSFRLPKQYMGKLKRSATVSGNLFVASALYLFVCALVVQFPQCIVNGNSCILNSKVYWNMLVNEVFWWHQRGVSTPQVFHLLCLSTTMPNSLHKAWLPTPMSDITASTCSPILSHSWMVRAISFFTVSAWKGLPVRQNAIICL